MSLAASAISIPRPFAHEEGIHFHGPAGRIEGIVSVPQAEKAAGAVAVVCHPHPLHGGSYNNKVTHTLARTLCKLGALTIRFNFRGVGDSAGQYDHGIGETQDLLAVIRAVRAEYPGREIWLAGFSFGAYIALHAAQYTEVDRLITIAPPVNIFRLAEMVAPACPWLLVQGKQDQLVPYQEVLRWATRIYPAPETVYLDDACHYFHGKLAALQTIITGAVAESRGRCVYADEAVSP